MSKGGIPFGIPPLLKDELQSNIGYLTTNLRVMPSTRYTYTPLV